MIDLKILEENPEFAKSLKLEVTGADLLAFGESIHRRASQEKIPEKDEQYLTAGELAKILKVSLVTVWFLRRTFMIGMLLNLNLNRLKIFWDGYLKLPLSTEAARDVKVFWEST